MALLLSGSGAWAQKLSPSTSLMLQDVRADQRKARQAIGTERVVSAFVTLRSPEAIGLMEQLGAKVNTKVSETLVTASIPMSAIEPISELDEVASVSVGTDVRLLMDQARKCMQVDECHKMETSGGPFTGRGVVVGIVDNGFQYDHVDFMSADGTGSRVKRVWDQHAMGNAPEGFSYGAEYKSLDEMRAARYDLANDYHATHVAGIASGSDRSTPYYGVAPDADLVFVSFKSTNAQIVDGIKYVFDYAESVGKPAVVNISLGSHMGPHDGTSDSDLAFARLVGPGRIIVGAAGNEGLSNLHASKTFTETDRQMKTMFAYDGMQDASSYKQANIDIWGDRNSPIAVKAVVVNTISGKVIASSEEITTEGAADEVKWIAPDGSGVVAQVGLSKQVNPNNGRTEVLLMSRATAINTGFALGVVVTGESGKMVHMWNNAYGSFTNYNKRGWTDGDNQCSVGELGGVSPDVISVGSYNSKMYFQPLGLVGGDEAYFVSQDYVGKQYEYSRFSSFGPTVDGRCKPDVSAPGCIIVSAASRYCSGWSDDSNVVARSGDDVYTYELGTSMASPNVAGCVALWLQANPTLTPEQVRDAIAHTAMSGDEFMEKGLSFPNNTWGYGRMDALSGLKYVMSATGVEDVAMMDASYKLTVDVRKRTATLHLGSGKGTAQLDVFNAAGQRVAERRNVHNGETVPLTELPKGIYVLRITQGEHVHAVKAVF